MLIAKLQGGQSFYKLRMIDPSKLSPAANSYLKNIIKMSPLISCEDDPAPIAIKFKL